MMCLSQVGCHRDASLHVVGLVCDGVFLIVSIHHGETHAGAAEAYNELVHLSSFFYPPPIMLAMQRTASSSAIQARIIFMSRLLVIS